MAICSAMNLRITGTPRPKGEIFKCWIDEFEAESDAHEFEALDSGQAAQFCIERAHQESSLSSVHEDDSYVVHVEAEDGTRTRWEVTARVTLWFDAVRVTGDDSI